MEITNQHQKVKQVQFIFWMNLAMTIFAFSVFMRSLDNIHLWKTVCSGAGFTIFLTLTTLVFIKMRRLQKASRY